MLVVLIAVVGLVFYLQNQEDDQMDELQSERNFAVPKEDITKLVIAEKSGKITTVEKVDDQWVLNDKYDVGEDVMAMVLNSLSRVRIQYIPPKAAYENIMDEMGRLGMKIMVYNKRGLAKSYYIGGVTPDESGTYYLMEGSDQPFVMEMPGMIGSPRRRYIKEIDQWRDRAIFNVDKEEIQSIAVDFPKAKDYSFTVDVNRRDYEVKPLYDSTEVINKEFNESSVEKFVTDISEVYMEAYVNDLPKKDTIIRDYIPTYSATITNEDGSKRKVNLYPYDEINDGKNYDVIEQESPIVRYYVYIQDENKGNDFGIAQHRIVKKMFWSYPQFFFGK